MIFTSDPTTAVNEVVDARVFGRYNVRGSMSAQGLLRLLDPKTGVLRREQRRERAKRFIQKFVGDENYHRLWSLLTRAKKKA